MALTASLRCYPLLGSAAAAASSSVSLPASTRAPVLHRTTGGPRRRLQRCLCSQQYAEKQSSGSQQQQLERLFSNLNQATMKHEPGEAHNMLLSTSLCIFVLPLRCTVMELFLIWMSGSVTSSIFLVAGTTVMFVLSSFAARD